jgi:hypothetical protein
MASGLSARAHSKVLESATELFAERGIDATSLDNTLTQAGTAARWERHGIGAQELAMHLLDTSAGVKSATGNLSDYKRRMALAIRIIMMGANGVEI